SSCRIHLHLEGSYYSFPCLILFTRKDCKTMKRHPDVPTTSRDFAKPVKAISLPQDVPSTSDRRLIKLKSQVQRLMEAHLAPKSSLQVNKIASSCEICSGPHDTQYYMENPEQAFVDYASSRTNEAGGKWFTFKPEQNNLGDTYNPSWKSHPNLSSFNNNPQNFNNQSNLEGLVSNFMASQDARLSKFEADFKQQQSEMTNKIDSVLKAITYRIRGALPSETVKNPKLNTSSVSSAHSYPMEDPQGSSQDRFEKEEADTMGEPTMEEYMTKTRDGYGLGIAWPKINEKAQFELKGLFLKELCDNTFSRSDHEDVNEHIEKVLEIVDLFHIPNITQDQEVILFYKGLDVPTRQILDSKGAIPTMTVTDAKVAIQEMA
ncbi:hypothetical protein Tco_0747843, partial [Tanacetum coccineum]